MASTTASKAIVKPQHGSPAKPASNAENKSKANLQAEKQRNIKAAKQFVHQQSKVSKKKGKKEEDEDDDEEDEEEDTEQSNSSEEEERPKKKKNKKDKKPAKKDSKKKKPKRRRPSTTTEEEDEDEEENSEASTAESSEPSPPPKKKRQQQQKKLSKSKRRRHASTTSEEDDDAVSEDDEDTDAGQRKKSKKRAKAEPKTKPKHAAAAPTLQPQDQKDVDATDGPMVADQAMEADVPQQQQGLEFSNLADQEEEEEALHPIDEATGSILSQLLTEKNAPAGGDDPAIPVPDGELEITGEDKATLEETVKVGRVWALHKNFLTATYSPATLLLTFIFRSHFFLGDPLFASFQFKLSFQMFESKRPSYIHFFNVSKKHVITIIKSEIIYSKKRFPMSFQFPIDKFYFNHVNPKQLSIHCVITDNAVLNFVAVKI